MVDSSNAAFHAPTCLVEGRGAIGFSGGAPWPSWADVEPLTSVLSHLRSP